MTILVEQR